MRAEELKPREPKPKDTDSLQAHIDWYVTEGFVVEFQAETNAGLVGPKQFSLGWFVFWWIIPGPGFFIYPIYHHFLKSKTIELWVKDGLIKVAPRVGPRLA